MIKENYRKLHRALKAFGLPPTAVSENQFFSDDFDVFSFGRPPFAIEILTKLKGIASFTVANTLASIEKVDDFEVRVIHLKHLLAAKKAAGRSKDINDLENLPASE